MKHFSMIVILLSVLVLFFSCQESTGSGTLKITIQTESKSILAGADAGRIIKYTISGKGPGNKSFSENTNSRTVTIEGLPNGTWEIEVNGLSDTGKTIATGCKTISFSGSNASEIIRIAKITGKGSLSVKLDWDSDILNPRLDFFIDNLQTGTSIQRTVTVGNNENKYTQTFDNIEAGYYLLRTILYDDDVKKAGSCEAFNVETDYITSGELSLSANAKDNQDETKLSLSKSGNNYLNATLGINDISLICDDNCNATLSLTNSIGTGDTISVAWYVDGELSKNYSTVSSTVSSFEFKVLKGRHIINAVLYDPSFQTCSSARIRYTGYNGEPNGTAVFSTTVDNIKQQKIKLDESTKLGVLPGGKFIILTPAQNTLQLCHISDSALIVDSGGTYTNTMENFSCISDATMLYSDSSSDYFIIVDNKTNVHLMYYNSKKNIIEPAVYVEDDSVVRFLGSFLTYASGFTDIDKACIITDSSGNCTVLFTDSYSYEIFSSQCTSNGVKTKDISFKPDGVTLCNAFAAYGSTIIYCNDNNLHQAQFDGRTASSVWKSSVIPDTYNAYKILFINNSNILIACSDRIKRIQFTATSGSYKILEDVNISATDICLSSDRSYMYACSSQGKLFSYATDYEGVFKQLDVYNSSKPFKQVAADSDNVLALTQEGTIYIFDIAKEEI